MDLQAISNAQATFAQALAIASENYHQGLANAERLRLCATSITEALIDSTVSPATLDPLSDAPRPSFKCRCRYRNGKSELAGNRWTKKLTDE